MRASEYYFRMIFYLIALGVFVIMVFPFYWMISASFKEPAEIFLYPPTLIPKTFVWTGYLKVIKETMILNGLKNSFIVALVSVLIGLMVNSLAGYSFARLRFRGKNIMFALVLASLMVPFQITLIPLFLMVKAFGWLDTYRGLIVPGLASSFGVFLMRQFFAQMPRELEDSAKIDGCSTFGIYLKIAVPLAKPVFLTFAVFTFMWKWDAFLWPLVVTTSNRLQVVQLVVVSLTQDARYGAEWNLIMAASVVASLPTLVIFLAIQKYYVSGIARTGLKG